MYGWLQVDIIIDGNSDHVMCSSAKYAHMPLQKSFTTHDTTKRAGWSDGKGLDAN